MKRIVLLCLVAGFLVVVLNGCGCQPATFKWQPIPTFAVEQTTPTRTVTVPYGAPVVQGVQYTQPTTYAAPGCP